MATGVSLHVGLNSVDPAQYDGWDGRLVACENDARDLAELARGAGLEETVVLTADGTTENITGELRRAARRLEHGDIFLFTYSGHGGQVPNAEGGDTEADEFDETLVFYDRQFLDDELYREFGRFADGVRILALHDSCHSGSGIEVREELTPEAMQRPFQTSDRDAAGGVGQRDVPRRISRIPPGHPAEHAAHPEPELLCHRTAR